MNINRKMLLSQPVRDYYKSQDKLYDELYIVPTRKKHNSGWMVMAIVGHMRKTEIFEIASYCDDINWITPNTEMCDFRTDCAYPSGIIHVWSRIFKFKVGHSSSTEIELIKNVNRK